MFNIKVESSFSSAHNLRGYKGRCEDLHGHNWRVQIEIEKIDLDKTGMVLDFRSVKMLLNSLLDKLDHKYLNKIPYFAKVNPTSESIAQYIYAALKKKLPFLKSVTVWESENCCATYSE